MNVLIQTSNNVGQDYPNNIESSPDENATCASFNPSGTFAGQYIAVGTLDGLVKIIHVDSWTTLRAFHSHAQQVSHVAWSRFSRFLLSTSSDSVLRIWDLNSAPHSMSTGFVALKTIMFDGPIRRASFDPKNSRVVLVDLSPFASPVLLNVLTEDRQALDCDGISGNISFVDFSLDGKLIFLGSSNGFVYIHDRKSVISTLKVANGEIQQISPHDKLPNVLAVMSSDRCIRTLMYDSDSLHIVNKFEDPVNRIAWRACGFSTNGNHVVGADSSHRLHLWDSETSRLVKILEGQRDIFYDMSWSPVLPSCFVTVTQHGFVHFWRSPPKEIWAAFHPRFEELDENIVYQEREDEFDDDAPRPVASRAESIDIYAVGDVAREEDDGDADPSFYVKLYPGSNR